MILAAHYPKDLEAQRFCQFFNHRYHFIEAESNGHNKPQWRTISHYPLEHRNLWNRYKDPDRLIGVSFGRLTHYALIDIDRGSPYHPFNDENQFKKLMQAYEDIGLVRCLLTQSSSSEGQHIYFPFPKELPTFKIAWLLKITALKNGFTVKDGWLEIFPNPKPYGQTPTSYKAHRLPLQTGSYLLDDDFQPTSNSISDFLNQAETAAQAQDIELLEGAMEAAYQTRKISAWKTGSTNLETFKRDLSEQIQEGWTDYGQTNDLLRIIGTYGRIFQGLEGQALADHIATTAQTLRGYTQYCHHQHHIHRRAREWARCVEKFYYPCGSEPNRIGTYKDMINEGSSQENQVNEQRSQQAIERIKAALNHLKQTLQQLPTRIEDLKTLIIETTKKLFSIRPSDKTLNRHRELWHPKYQKENPPVLQPETPQDPLPEEPFDICPTPPVVVPETTAFPNQPKSLPSNESEQSAPPPLYMKVKNWVLNQLVLIYTGQPVYNTVEIEGEKRSKIQTIQQNQEIVITDCTHSSFLLYPEDEEKLQIYVRPFDVDNWITGIAVFAKFLQLKPP